MAAIILFGILENEDNQNSGNLYIERLLSHPDDVLRFDDKTLIDRYRFPRAMILQLYSRAAATSVGEANEATWGCPGSRSTDQCTTAFCKRGFSARGSRHGGNVPAGDFS
jgi:hypothetical protein